MRLPWPNYVAIATLAGCAGPLIAQLVIHSPQGLKKTDPKAQSKTVPKAAPVPAPKPPPPLDVRLAIPAEEFKLANGLRVILSRDNAVPVVSLAVLYDAGFRYEGAGQAGFAHLFEHMLTDGAANAGAGALAKYAETNGGKSEGSALPDYALYSTTVPANHLAPALWMEAGRMGHLVIDAESVKARVDSIGEERKRLFELQGYSSEVMEAWPKLIFQNPQNARSFIGGVDDLKSATAETAMAYFKQWYSPSNAVLVVAGDFQTAEARKAVEQYFGGIPSQPPPEKPSVAEAPRVQGKSAYAADPRVGAPAVILGWPAPARHSPEWYAVRMLDALLTDGPLGTLNVNLVEGRRSLLQTQSGIGWPMEQAEGARDPSEYSIFALARPGLRAVTIPAEIQNEIDGVGVRGIDDADLRRVKAALRTRTITRLQSASERALLLARYAAADGDVAWIDKDMVALMQVTAPQVQAIARRILTAARRDTLIIEAPTRPTGRAGSAAPATQIPAASAPPTAVPGAGR